MPSNVQIVIDDNTNNDVIFNPNKGRGLIPRNYDTHPEGYFATPMKSVNISLIPESEYSDRIKEKEAQKAAISHIRMRANKGNKIPALNQGQCGYCWAHSATMAVMMMRALANMPYLPLSAYAVAAIIKNGRDEGGWGALAAEWIEKNGVPDQKYWPQGNRNLANNSPEMRANAALHKITKGWVDLAAPVYNRNLSFQQVATLLLSNVGVVGDFNWWGHSIYLMDLVEIEPGSFGIRFLNSWGDEWGNEGVGILRGDKAIPDGAVAPLSTTVSVASAPQEADSPVAA